VLNRYQDGKAVILANIGAVRSGSEETLPETSTTMEINILAL
jgi:hypothetical protein